MSLKLWHPVKYNIWDQQSLNPLWQRPNLGLSNFTGYVLTPNGVKQNNNKFEVAKLEYIVLLIIKINIFVDICVDITKCLPETNIYKKLPDWYIYKVAWIR